MKLLKTVKILFKALENDAHYIQGKTAKINKNISKSCLN